MPARSGGIISDLKKKKKKDLFSATRGRGAPHTQVSLCTPIICSYKALMRLSSPELDSFSQPRSSYSECLSVCFIAHV